MSDEATNKSGKTWLYVVGVLVSLPLTYVLSVGPVLKAASSMPEPATSIVLSIYWPLDWFRIHGPSWFQSGFDAYMALWGFHFH
jgi:hypothetical protein